MKSRNAKSRSAWELGPWSQPIVIWKASYKEGHAPIGRLTIKDIWGDDRGRQIQSKFDHRFGWAISQVRVSGYLESSGVKIPEMRSPKIS
jgi:hypothetical protein